MTDSWGQPPAPQYAPQAPQQQYAPAPQQQYAPPPQQGWAPPAQQAPPAPKPPTAEELWRQNQGGGDWAPSFKFDQVGSGLLGVILSWRPVPKTLTNGAQKVDKNGTPMWQHVVVLQTDLRDWQGVAKIPTDDTPAKNPLPPSADDGKRSIYLWYTLRDAVAAAVQAAGRELPEPGWELGVKVSGTRPNNQGGTDIKEYVAIYRPQSGMVKTPIALPGAAPVASADFSAPEFQAPPVQQGYAAQPAPAPQQQYAPPPQQPMAPPPVAPQPQYAPGPPAPQQGAPVYQGEPPF